MDIGSKLKHLRKAKGLTASELAEKVNITREHLSAVENNIKPISLTTLEKICEALGMTLSEFFCEGDFKLSPEYREILQNLKILSPEQLRALNEFLKTLK
ncbi:MAG TPA: helix-turn-helix transcriptional regulator [Thermoanaerobacterales bacterium]|nr:helix-turn-helix transcriptional regulator [Thermoanaerobacterales bacterium]